MLKVRPIIVATALLSGAIISNAQAQTASYDSTTHVLTVPSIQVGNTVYSNLSYRVDSGTILSIGPGVATSAGVTCTDANITLDSYNAVAVGMTVDQIDSVFGCAFAPRFTTRTQIDTTYVWQSPSRSVSIIFDATGTTVTPEAGTFKIANGF